MIINNNAKLGFFNDELIQNTIPCEYIFLTQYNEFFIAAKKYNKFGIIDKFNNIIYELNYNTITNINGYYIIEDILNSKFEILDSNLNLKLSVNNIFLNIKSGNHIIIKNDLYGLVDKNFDFLINFDTDLSWLIEQDYYDPIKDLYFFVGVKKSNFVLYEYHNNKLFKIDNLKVNYLYEIDDYLNNYIIHKRLNILNNIL
jgi:hypothetical protein